MDEINKSIEETDRIICRNCGHELFVLRHGELAHIITKDKIPIGWHCTHNKKCFCGCENPEG